MAYALPVEAGTYPIRKSAQDVNAELDRVCDQLGDTASWKTQREIAALVGYANALRWVLGQST